MKKIFLVLLVILGFAFQTTFATDGYYRHGYGIKYSALAGSGVAVSLSSLGAITNPAAISYLNNGFEVNVSYFSPDRHYSVYGNPSGYPGTFGLMPGRVTSDSKSFYFPTLGANLKITDKFTIALSLYGNGGMNSDYQAMTFGDPTSPGTGVNIEQMFGNLSFAYKVSENHSFGVAGIFGWQRFAAKGLIAFSGFSSDPANLTGNSFSTAYGFGFKVGYQGKWLDDLSFGAAFQSKIYMSEFDRYAGLFAQAGDFDVPANWQAGFAFTPGDWKFLVDVKQILYGDVKSIANPMFPNLMTAQLGNEEGAGFGWKNILIFKYGVMYSGFCGWDLMAGYSISQNPVSEENIMFNILAPGVIENQVTLGVTKKLAKSHEISVAFMYGFENSIEGANALEAPNQQTIEIGMKQWQVEVGYAFSSF
ncbi:MAG: outer membrane protein transport protein [Ignavibacteriaceae bacterium]